MTCIHVNGLCGHGQAQRVGFQRAQGLSRAHGIAIHGGRVVVRRRRQSPDRFGGHATAGLRHGDPFARQRLIKVYRGQRAPPAFNRLIQANVFQVDIA